MAHRPDRPFESLEWYRDAARNNFRDDNPRGGIARWASGFGMLHTHISVFAVCIVLLLAINLLRSPGSIWADRWIMAWTVLILIHAVAAGIFWAVRQWNADVPDEPLQMRSPHQWRQSDLVSWGAPEDVEAQDVAFRVTDADVADAVATVAEVPDAPSWTGWNAEVGFEQEPDAERASWKEASAAAWLDRGPATPEASNDPEADSRK